MVKSHITKCLLTIFSILVFTISGNTQETLSFEETVGYINKMMQDNTKKTFGVYKMDADPFGNVKFHTRFGAYWFNMNDVAKIERDRTDNLRFIFPPVYYGINCDNPLHGCYLSGMIDGNQPYKIWPNGSISFPSGAQLQIKLAEALMHLKELTQDPVSR